MVARSWPGTILRERAPWLRFYDAEENLVLLPAEYERQEKERAEQRAESAEQRAEQERQARLDSVVRLLALGLGTTEVAAALALPLETVV